MAVQIGPRYWQPPGWDDLVQPAYSKAFNATTGRMNLNLAEAGVDFEDNARYPDESLFIPYQMSHAVVPGSAVEPHIHWLQAQDADPNWLIDYRVYPNGAAPPASWTLAIPTTARAFAYPGSGTIVQITSFPEIALSGVSQPMSAWVDLRLYRDTANASGLFSGADAYSGAATVKSPDAHIRRNRLGSGNRYTG